MSVGRRSLTSNKWRRRSIICLRINLMNIEDLTAKADAVTARVHELQVTIRETEKAHGRTPYVERTHHQLR